MNNVQLLVQVIQCAEQTPCHLSDSLLVVVLIVGSHDWVLLSMLLLQFVVRSECIKLGIPFHAFPIVRNRHNQVQFIGERVVDYFVEFDEVRVVQLLHDVYLLVHLIERRDVGEPTTSAASAATTISRQTILIVTFLFPQLRLHKYFYRLQQSHFKNNLHSTGDSSR